MKTLAALLSLVLAGPAFAQARGAASVSGQPAAAIPLSGNELFLIDQQHLGRWVTSNTPMSNVLAYFESNFILPPNAAAANLGFTPAKIVNPIDSGAKCDGATDDTTAFNTAITAQGSGTFVIPGVCKVNGTVNFTGPVAFGPNGQLACGASNVNFKSTLDASRRQIFASGCTPGFWSSTRPHAVAYPEWWGAAGDGNGAAGNGTDNTTPLTNALASGVQVLDFAANSYYRFTTIPTTRGSITLKGADRGSTHLVQDDSTGTADGLFFNGHSGQITVKNLTLDRAQAGVGSLAAAFVVNGGSSCPAGTTATLNSGTNTTPAVVTVATDDGSGHALTLNVTTAGAYTSPAPRTATLTTTPAIVPSALSGSCSGLTVKPQWTGPALIHTQDTYYVTIADNMIGGSSNAWDAIRLDTSAQTNNQVTIENNQIFGGEHDGIYLLGSASHVVSDVFTGPNNYIKGWANAGIEHLNNVSGVYTHLNVIYNNRYGLYVDSTGVATGSNKFRANDIDTDGSGNYFYNSGITLFQDNWNNGTPLICALCQGFQGIGNHFAVNSGAAITLNGSTGVSLAASFINGGAANPVAIGPLGSTQTTAVYLSGVYSPGAGSGSLITASGTPSNISVDVRLPASTGLVTGSAITNFFANTSGVQTDGGVQISAAANGIQGNLYNSGGWKYFANGGAGAVMFGNDFNSTGSAHPIEFLRATNNSGGNNASASPALGGYVNQFGQWTWLGMTASNQFMSVGGAATITGTCGTGTYSGGQMAGKMVTTATCAAGGTIIATNASSGNNGMDCRAHDLTTPAALLNPTAQSATSVTFTVAGSSLGNGDTITWSCMGF